MTAAGREDASAIEPVRVRACRESDLGRWDAYVLAHPQASFFHRGGWREIYQTVFRHRTHYLVAERGGRIVGLLPLVELKSLLFGHSLVSLPFAVYGGAIADDEDALNLLHDHADHLGTDLGVDFVEIRNRAPVSSGWPAQNLHVTFRKTLQTEVEANLLEIPRKQRAMVRKGIQRELRHEIDDDNARFFALYADNLHRHGTPPQPKKYFDALRTVFKSDCEVLTVLSPQGKPVSAVMSFYFRDEVLPYYAGDLVDARALAANDFKYWALMRLACERRLRIFDFGRSKRDSGSFDFKKNWGFEPEPLHYQFRLYNRADIPQHNPANPKYRHAIELWRRMPRVAVNAIGPVLARHLG